MITMEKTVGGQFLVIPENDDKRGGLVSFLKKYYLTEYELSNNKINNLLKDADCIIITKGELELIKMFNQSIIMKIRPRNNGHVLK